MLVIAVLAVHYGVEKLGHQGPSDGMKNYPTCGRNIPVDYMKAFLHGFPHMWANRKNWDLDKSVLTFDFIPLFPEKYNILRKMYLSLLT